MTQRKRGNDGNQSANLAKRNDQAQQKQKMVDAAQDVADAEHHETARSLLLRSSGVKTV